MNELKSNAFMDNAGKLIIENARLIYRNFKGTQSQFNHEGDRNFCVFIDDPDQAAELKEAGWNVKIRKPRDEEDAVAHYVKVNVSYRYKSPKVYLHVNDVTRELDEDEVGLLDDTDILSCDIIVNPSRWERPDGTSGISGYLDTLHVVMVPDYFANKYTPFEG